jgi:hypothetical protein
METLLRVTDRSPIRFTMETERGVGGSICWLSSRMTLLLVALGPIAGCSEVTVPAQGSVSIEGKSAPPGRLTLNPVGEGERAYAVVGSDGLFALRTSDWQMGAVPGDYRVVFQHPVGEQDRTSLTERVAGELSASEVNIVYRSAADQPFVIPDSGSEDLKIEIRQSGGWKRYVSE